MAKKKKNRLASVSNSTSISADDSTLSSSVESSSSRESGRSCPGCKGC